MKPNTIITAALATLLAGAIQAQNLTIVSIGDSYASGEGNPNSFNGTTASWSNTPCHRSVNNGRRIASDRINALPGVNVNFVDFSCSGATVNNGLTGSMTSVAPETPNVNITAQLDRVANFQQANGNLPIDILMVSIGGNDAGFGTVVLECMLPGNCTTNANVQNAVQRISSVLPGRLDNLAAQIAARLNNVRFVYLTEYPNPTRSDSGQFCDEFAELFSAQDPIGQIAMSGISGAESQFLQNSFLVPLNNQLEAAAGRHAGQGWRYISGVEQTFLRHGFCNGPSQRWMNTLSDSFARQGNVKGTMHPNVEGHRAYADAIIRRATVDFNLPLETPRITDIVEVNDPLVNKRIKAEVSQTAATLQVRTLFRIRNVIEFSTPDFASVTMTDTGAGALNFFDAALPNTSVLAPGQRIEYRIRVTASRNGATTTTTTGSRFIEFGEFSN
ncbi:MAG: SGNH/GDSL hydrolase family protein [Acidobacteria bacterium]|nr:SGNH/GDSL hydrolase family protein [Acidobacteriota bacterium]